MLAQQALRKAVARPLFLECKRSFGALNTIDDGNLHIKVNGRQSVSGITATVFGGGGFLGRYVINRLGRIGSQCVIPYRGDGMNVRHLKLMGDLGQIVPIPVDFCDEDTLRVALEKSNVVINLIGNDHTTANYSYHDTNVKCVYRLAKLAAETGLVKRFVHMSALGADSNSASDLLKSKAEGEEVVRDFFPDATIIRSAPMFGMEDRFLNRYADLCNFSPIVPVVDGGASKVQPVYVQDVAQAIVNSLVHEEAPGKIVEAVGPEIYSHANLVEFVAAEICRDDASPVTFPSPIARFAGSVADKLAPARWRLFTKDMVDQMETDQVETGNPGHLTLEDLDITPRKLQQESSMILKRHRGIRQQQRQARLEIK